LQLENRLKKTKNTNKIIINKKEIEKIKKFKVETKEIEIKLKITKTNTNTKTNIKTNTKIVIIAIITTINRKYLLKLYKQFVYIYISFVLKTILILLNYLLLFNNL